MMAQSILTWHEYHTGGHPLRRENTIVTRAAHNRPHKGFRLGRIGDNSFCRLLHAVDTIRVELDRWRVEFYSLFDPTRLTNALAFFRCNGVELLS